MALRQLLSNLSDPSTTVDSSAYPTQANHLEAVTFNQRSFRFGEGRAFDQSGGGFSREPFIGNPRALLGSRNQSVPEAEESASKLENTLGFIDGVTDGLVRGGLLTALQRSTTDFTRLTNFYLSNRGIGFLLKQTLLQATNPSIEDGGISVLGLRRNRQFNPLGTNLLAQSLVNFSGIHFDRAGLLPIWPEDQKYEKIVRNKANKVGQLNPFGSKKTNEFIGNRLLTLLEDRIKPHIPEPQLEENNNGGTPDTPEQKWYEEAWDATKGFVKSVTGKNDPMLYEYGGGPGSTYGIGRTSIRRFENTLTSENFSKARLRRQGDVRVQPSIHNYLRTIGRPGTSYTSPAGGGRFTNRESRIGTGDPGAKNQLNEKERDIYISQTKLGDLNYNYWNTTENYNSPLPGAFKKSDLINMLDIFKAEGNFAVPEARDLIRFRFEAMDNDHPTKSKAMIFRALLDDLQDSYNANYNEFNYNGRGEAFYTYENFKRNINFSFKIAAQTRQEMMPLYRKLNYLVAQTAPEYKKGRMRAGFVRLSIGSWIDRVPGFIQNITLSWQKDYPWEIAIDSGTSGQDKGMLVLPHVLDVKVSFLPVHNFAPQRSIKESPFILSHENNRRLNKEQKWYKLDAAKNSKDAVRLGITRLEELFPNDPPKKAEDPPIIIADEDLDIDDSYLDEEEEEFDFETQTQPDIDPNAGLPGAMGSEGY